MQIRPYTPADLPHLYDICLKTGAAGADATASSSHPRLLGDYYAAPYAAFDPSLCLILADAAGPCGYIVGAADTRAFVDWFNTTWLPRVREVYHDLRPAPGATDEWLIHLMRQDAAVPRGADEFPAHLHIDLLPRAQGKGWGKTMFREWTALASAHGAHGLHLGVAPANDGAIRFYESLGMRRLDTAAGAILFTLKLGGNP